MKKKRIFLCLLFAINVCVCMAQTIQKHTVQRGETLESVATKYGVTTNDIKQANPTMGELFYVGMVLNIPQKNNKTMNTEVTSDSQSHPQKTYTLSSPATTSSTPTSSYTNTGRQGEWDVTGRLGWIARDFQKGVDIDGFGLTFLLGANYFFDDKAFLKFCVGYGLTTKRKDDVTYNMDSFRLPISINYFIPIRKTGGFSFGFGPYMDYAVTGKSEYKGTKIKFSDSDDYNKMVFGAHICCSLMFCEDFGLYGEYGFGITERFKDSKENYWSVGLAYGF